MQKKQFSIRVEIGRINKLRQVAANRKKTMTQLVEDWIDSLEVPESK